MGLYLNHGNQFFQQVLNGEIYVDKTGLIKFMNKWLETPDRYVCVSRARRFGKSIAAQMLEAYYCKTCDSREMFAPFEIAKDPSFEKGLNQYNVISIDVQTFMPQGAEIKTFITRLKRAIGAEIRAAWPDLELKGKTIPDMLAHINDKTGEKFVIIIDEWDAIFRNAPEDTVTQKAWIHFLRDMFKQNTSNSYLALAYLTGILPVKKYKTQSSLNNFKEYTMIAPDMVAPYVGFTEDEVIALCHRFNMDIQEAAYWYDGYRFLDIEHVYNPNSICNCMQRRRFGSYWTETASFESLLDFINADLDGIYADVECLVTGGRVAVNTSTYDNSFTTPKCKDDAFTCLIHIGYLAYDAEAGQAFIPNEEVRLAFVNALSICNWPDAIKPWQRSRRFLEAILREDAETAARIVEETHQNMTSVIKYNDENALSCVISILCIAAENEYLVVREMPSGKGFADIVLIPKPRTMNPVIVIELKFKKDVRTAIDQIHDNQYPDRLKDFSGEVILAGMSYTKRKAHDCVIERFERNA